MNCLNGLFSKPKSTLFILEAFPTLLQRKLKTSPSTQETIESSVALVTTQTKSEHTTESNEVLFCYSSTSFVAK